MKALTLWRPWDQLVLSGRKAVENRPWAPKGGLEMGEVFAIHAGKKWDDGCVAMAQELGVPLSFFNFAAYPGVVGVVKFMGIVHASADPWFCGPVGWLLAEPEKFATPVPCNGMQGLWEIPAVEMRFVAAQREEFYLARTAAKFSRSSGK